MPYLHLFLFLVSFAISYALFGYLLNHVLLRLPLKEMKLGYPKITTIAIAGVPLKLGLVPIHSSFELTDEFVKECSRSRWAMNKALNMLLQVLFCTAWLLIGHVTWDVLQDCGAYMFFQMTMTEFVALHGPLDIWKTGSFAISIVWISLLMQLVTPRTENSRAENLFLWLNIFVLVGTLISLVRLCIGLWGH